ncbi:T3SS effector HopA1 family protein [Actinocrispum sp. NPDC049592]|uniref:T3SS effector HopA1 family protein n=1 Tax=Actinocrispum sp. NPDC049592 TaxID=3154835 RepID=UPI00341C9A70
MTTLITTVPAALAEALRSADIDPVRLTARFGDRRVSAGSPAELRGKLASALYDMLHVGRDKPGGQRPRDHQDEDFESRLRSVVPHAHTLAPASIVDHSPATGIATVELAGVRVRLPVSGTPRAGQHVLLKVDCVRPRLSPGFLLVEGSAGNGLGDGPILRVYMHLADARHAVRLWSAVLGRLELLAVPYRAKITSTRAGLPRRDGLVIYLGPRAWHAAREVAAAVADLPGLGRSISLYASPLGPGVATAWEPDDSRAGFRGRSFGEHRSLAIATGLLAHAQDPSICLEARLTAALTAANIVAGRPSHNTTSPSLPDITS